MQNKQKKHLLTLSILSLSLLTVMAGAAVAPALNVISKHFSNSPKLLIQLIISIPAIFIVITNMFFPKLCKYMHAKTLVMAGLLLYVIGGIGAGLFDNIYMILVMRAIVGIGVGIIMPLSTGLLTFYYTRDKHDKLMGLSSACNQLGGVIATLMAGALANVSWRATFLVYLMGLISIILCAFFIPNESILDRNTDSQKESILQNIKKYYSFIIAMFLLMLSFFIYPCSFAIESAKTGIITQKGVAIIMATMDFIAFFGGLAYVKLKQNIRNLAKIFAPILFFAGYILISSIDNIYVVLFGSMLIGFANGFGIPYLISTASGIAGKTATTTVIPLLSAAMYLAQFLTPILLSVFSGLFADFTHPAYISAICISGCLIIWSQITIMKIK